MNLTHFEFDRETLIITGCPANEKPLYSEQYRKGGRSYGEPDALLTVMDGHVCEKCKLKNKCPGMFSGGGVLSEYTFRINFDLKSLRLLVRRENEKTEAFKETYKKRSGIEATNSGLKQKTGMGRLRVRGKKRVTMAVLLKIAGWNIFRASCATKMNMFVKEATVKAGLALSHALLGDSFPIQSPENPIFRILWQRGVFFTFLIQNLRLPLNPLVA